MESELNLACLAEEVATIVDVAEAGLVPDNKIIIRQWALSDPTQTMQAVAFLQQHVSVKNDPDVPYNYVDNPMVNGEIKEGRWRLSSARGIVSGGQNYAREVLLYGLVKTGDALPTPELVTAAAQVLTTHATVTGSNHTYREVRYKAIDPDYAEALKTSIGLTQAGITATKLVKMEDGSFNIHAMADKTVWALCYVTTDVGAKWDVSEVTEYRYNIEESDIQGYVDPYTDKEVGKEKRVSLSRNSEDGTFNFVGVVRSAAGKDDYTMASALYINCDTTIQYAFLWGASKAESDAFIADYATPPTAGVSYEYQINHREDGFLDVTVLIRTAVPHADPTVPDFDIDLPVGTKITKTDARGYNINIEEIDAVTAYYESKKAVGVTVTFSVTRKNECLFDYIANVVTVDHIGQTLSLAADADYGLDIASWSGLYASTNGDLPVGAVGVVGARERVSIDLQPNEDETFNYRINRTKVGETNDSKAIAIAGTGTGVTIAFGKNATVANVSTAISNFTAGARKRQDISITPNDDKTLDYVIKESSVQQVFNSKAYGRNTVYYGHNADVLPTVTDVLRSISVAGNDDGTISYLINSEEFFDLADDVTDPDGAGQLTHVQYGINQDAVPDPMGDKVRSVSVSEGDNGKVNYHIVSQDPFSGTGSVTDGNVTVYYGEDAAVKPVVTGEVMRSASVSYNEQGKLNYIITTIAEFTDEATISDTSTYNKRHYQHGINVGTVATPTGKRVLSAQVSEGEKGTLNYGIVSEDADEITGTEFVAKMGGLVAESITTHSKSPDEPTVAADGESISDLRMDEDGLYTYLLHKLTLDATPVYYDEYTSEIEWDIKDHQITMPKWADGAGGGWRYVTGYVDGLVTYSRNRLKETTSTVTFSLTKPAPTIPNHATPGSFGGYTKHTTVIKQVGDLWAMVESDIVADDWSAIDVTDGEIIFDWTTLA